MTAIQVMTMTMTMTTTTILVDAILHSQTMPIRGNASPAIPS